MDKKIKIIYEDFKRSNKRYVPEIKSVLVSFGNYNTEYVETMSYEENFDAFVNDVFECGFLYLNDKKALSVFQVKSFEMVQDEKENKEVKNEVNEEKNEDVTTHQVTRTRKRRKKRQ